MQTPAYRPIGQTYCLSVANTQHADVTINSMGNEPCMFAAFLNSGTVDVLVTVSPVGVATPSLTFPSDGTPSGGKSFMLHANSVNQPVVLEVPVGSNNVAGFSVSAIGAAAGPSAVYITPVGKL